VEGGEGTGDRRQHTDRRAGGQSSGEFQGRRGAKRTPKGLVYLVQAVVAIVMLLSVIVLVVRSMNPVYATKGKLGDELRKRAPAAAVALGAGVDSTNLDRLMATPKFQEEKRNFYEDVMRLKQVDSARADSIAQFAVREAYVRGISPAIIFGVMLTENSRFISKAQSNVGAVGLMQVYPKVWLTKEMTKMFGRDLVSDSTNVKYGVFILSHYFNPKVKGGGTRERDWQTALLRYNGCVRGTNTPRCHTYPNKVQNFVENQATSICDGRSFYQCIAKPFIDGLFEGGKLAKDSSTKEVVAKAAEVAEDSAAKGATVVAAGEVVSAAPGLVRVPPVVVTAPDSVIATPMPVAPKVAASSTTKKAAVKKATVKKSTARKAPAKKAPVKKKSRRASS
jgi:hypothetical protein